MLKYLKKIDVLIIFTLLWVFLIVVSKSVASGFHLTDNHGLLAIEETLTNHSFFKTCLIYINQNLFEQHRFFPLIVFFRITFIKIFGVNFLSFSIFHLFLAIITSYNFYSFFKNEGYSKFTSIIFPILILIGEQTAVWWRLGTAESLAMFIISAILLLMQKNISKNFKPLLPCTIGILIVLLTLCKENFILLVPALLFWYLVLILKGENITFIKAFKGQIFFLSVITIVIISELLFIVIFIGTNNGYTGISFSDKFLTQVLGINPELNIKGLINYFVLSFLNFERVYSYYFIIISVGLFITFNFYFNKILDLKKGFTLFYFENKYLIFLVLLIIIPQKLIYLQSGIYERFFLPFSLGIGLIIGALFESIYFKFGLNIFIRKSYLILILACLSFKILTSFNSSREFAREGKQTNSFLQGILSHTVSSDTIVVVLDPSIHYEWGFSIKRFLNHFDKKLQIKYLTIDSKTNDDFHKKLYDEFTLVHKNELIDEEEALKQLNISFLPSKNDLDIEKFKTKLLSEGFKYQSYGEFALFLNE